MPTTEAAQDDLRVRLLDAATRVFARKGYDGTKILDIVKEAGLSTGAVYGRFKSKRDLLLEAVTSRSRSHLRSEAIGGVRVADLLQHMASSTSGALTDVEAVRVEAYVAARREPEVAAALAEASAGWRTAIEPLIEQAIADGSLSRDVDSEAVIYLVQTLGLGLLLQRGAGTAAPDPTAWGELLHNVIASFGDPERTAL